MGIRAAGNRVRIVVIRIHTAGNRIRIVVVIGHRIQRHDRLISYRERHVVPGPVTKLPTVPDTLWEVLHNAVRTSKVLLVNEGLSPLLCKSRRLGTHVKGLCPGAP